MRAVIRSGLVVLALIPAALSAQEASPAPNAREYGIDFTYSYGMRSDDQTSWVAGMPADIRVGFRPRNRMMWEAHFSFEAGGNDAGTSHYGGLGISALFAGDHRSGMYLLAGASGSYFATTGSDTEFTPSVVAGVGTRLPRGPAAIRLEAFARYALEGSAGAPSQTRIGVRAGFSIWH
jgi:hypothetical protein